MSTYHERNKDKVRQNYTSKLRQEHLNKPITINFIYDDSPGVLHYNKSKLKKDNVVTFL